VYILPPVGRNEQDYRHGSGNNSRMFEARRRPGGPHLDTPKSEVYPKVGLDNHPLVPGHLWTPKSCEFAVIIRCDASTYDNMTRTFALKGRSRLGELRSGDEPRGSAPGHTAPQRKLNPADAGVTGVNSSLSWYSAALSKPAGWGRSVLRRRAENAGLLLVSMGEG
jgi:hypothetical protein